MPLQKIHLGIGVSIPFDNWQCWSVSHRTAGTLRALQVSNNFFFRSGRRLLHPRDENNSFGDTTPEGREEERKSASTIPILGGAKTPSNYRSGLLG